MLTRFLSVSLPCLPTDRIARRGAVVAPGPSSRSDTSDRTPPLVTIAKVKGAHRIVCADRAASAAGLKPGMALADARAIRPDLQAAESDAAGEAALLDRVIDWCRRFTPLVAPDGADGVVLDVTGAAHLFGGEAALAGAIRDGLARQGLTAWAGVAATPEAAWAWARFGPDPVAPPPSDAGFGRLVAALPVAALRIEPGLTAALARAGLRRVGDLLMRPRGPIAARFGAGVLERLDGLMGLGKAPITPRFEAPLCLAERRFASGLARAEQVEAALLPLCRHLCTLLDQQGRGARRIEASFFRVDGAVKRIVLGTSRPTREPDKLVALFRERLAAIGEVGLDTGYGFEVIRLGVTEAERFDPRQDGFAGGDAGETGRDMADLADRLGARLGTKRVVRLAGQDTHRPEDTAVAVAAVGDDSDQDSPGTEGELCRPVRLFERPEPIEAIAAVPDGPPVRFRWRRVTHEVAAVEGPERIAPAWWRDEAPTTRDYFRAEDRHGRRFWLYREGLLGRETTETRWFLHGLFG